jgi:hypothetical protein
MDLLGPDFTLVRGRPAYDVAEVDEAVAETRRLLAGHPPMPGASRGGFRLVDGEGYDARQVDAWRHAVRRELAIRADERWSEGVEDDPPELRGVPRDSPYPSAASSSFSPWVRFTALVLVVAVAAFFVASYFV